jgi:hypothetical protein
MEYSMHHCGIEPKEEVNLPFQDIDIWVCDTIDNFLWHRIVDGISKCKKLESKSKSKIPKPRPTSILTSARMFTYSVYIPVNICKLCEENK